MNNREWYTEAIRFCQLSASCACCPYHLLTEEGKPVVEGDRPCFASKEALLALDDWLAEEHACENNYQEEESDHQWLQNLMRLQFHEEEDAEDPFFDDDLF
ncbi:MAG: hypothetical protein AB7D92_11295 [Sphaerochaeta sp.]